MKFKKSSTVETMTIGLVIIGTLSYLVYLYSLRNPLEINNHINVSSSEAIEGFGRGVGGVGVRGGGWGFGRWTGEPYIRPDGPLPPDALVNPYRAPYRGPWMVPVNVPTSSVDVSFRQMGILTPLNGNSENNIMQLMGRPLFTNRNKWQYYAISNQFNGVKLPLLVKQRNGLDEYGVDEVYNGDTVLVEGTDQPYKVTIYEGATIQYLPFV